MAEDPAIDTAPPDPGDDSANLRRDIADELADHLELATRSQMLKGKHEPAAQRDALARFGSPAAIARQLYLSAMKGKLMRQNIQTAAIVCMALAVIVLGAMSWMALRAGQRAMVESMTLNNEAMLHAITAVGRSDGPDQPVPPLDIEWSTLDVTLVDAQGDTFDTSGYQVTLWGELINATSKVEMRRPVESGQPISFGPIRIGQHNLIVLTPGGYTTAEQTVTLLPNPEGKQLTIQCPTPSQLIDPPAIEIAWPESLVETNIALNLRFITDERTTLGSDTWTGRDLEYICRPGHPPQFVESDKSAQQRSLIPGMFNDGFSMTQHNTQRFIHPTSPILIAPAAYRVAGGPCYWRVGDNRFCRWIDSGNLYFTSEYDAASHRITVTAGDTTWNKIHHAIQPILAFEALPDEQQKMHLEQNGY